VTRPVAFATNTVVTIGRPEYDALTNHIPSLPSALLTPVGNIISIYGPYPIAPAFARVTSNVVLLPIIAAAGRLEVTVGVAAHAAYTFWSVLVFRNGSKNIIKIMNSHSVM
jgi:hypothetical protein